ncbi:ClbS/DfsB family four-helix bundle protein [Bifidobacterium animalis]
MLAYQLGWIGLLPDWEHAEQEGHVMHMPAPPRVFVEPIR